MARETSQAINLYSCHKMSYGMPLLFIGHILAGTAGFAQGSISIDVRSQADVPTCYSVTKHIR